MRQIKAAFLLAFAITFAIASMSAVANAAPVVRILQQRCQNGSCRQGLQSGSVIGRDARTHQLVIVTCAHQYWHDVPALVEIEADGQFEEGRLIAYDDEDDVAILLVDHPRKTSFIALAADLPEVGDRLSAWGFAAGKKLKSQSGQVKSLDEKTGKLMLADVSFEQGQSGGPAVNADGELVATLTGNAGDPMPVEELRRLKAAGREPRMRHGLFCSLPRIRRILARCQVNISVNGAGKSATKTAKTPPPADPTDPNAAAPAPPPDIQPGPPGIDTGALKAGIKFDLESVFKEHLAASEARVRADIQANGKDALPVIIAQVKAQWAPELKSVGTDIVSKVGADAKAHLEGPMLGKLAGLLPSIAPLIQSAVPALGIGSIATGVGAPLGLALLFGHWLLSRAVRRHTSAITNALTSSGSNGNSSNGSPQSLPAPTGAGTQPPDKVLFDTTRTVSPDTSLRMAYSSAKQDFAKKEPNSMGAIELFEALLNQRLGGLKSDPINS